MFSVQALGSGSRFRLSVQALGSGSRFRLSVQALGSCSRFRLSVHALGSGSRFRLSVQALGSWFEFMLRVHAPSSCSEFMFRVHVPSSRSGFTFRVHVPSSRSEFMFWVHVPSSCSEFMFCVHVLSYLLRLNKKKSMGLSTVNYDADWTHLELWLLSQTSRLKRSKSVTNVDLLINRARQSCNFVNFVTQKSELVLPIPEEQIGPYRYGGLQGAFLVSTQYGSL